MIIFCLKHSRVGLSAFGKSSNIRNQKILGSSIRFRTNNPTQAILLLFYIFSQISLNLYNGFIFTKFKKENKKPIRNQTIIVIIIQTLYSS